jgi:hypothetical protein
MDAEEWEWGIRNCHGKFLVSTSPGLSQLSPTKTKISTPSPRAARASD